MARNRKPQKIIAIADPAGFAAAELVAHDVCEYSINFLGILHKALTGRIASL